MATLCGGGGGCSGVSLDRLSCKVSNNNLIIPEMCFLKTPTFRNPGLRVSCSMRASKNNDGKMKKFESDSIGFKREEDKEVIAGECLDVWMRESVVEIVKNLKEAPLFVHVHSSRNNNGSGEAVELRMEKVVEEENWEALKAKWENGNAPVPDGLIFVEVLKENIDEFDDHDNGGGGRGHGGLDGGLTQVWGLVVQGRGMNCGPVCYLLKTSRVASGLGMYCTHFCLTKVTDFRESLKNQFMNCWLSTESIGKGK